MISSLDYFLLIVVIISICGLFAIVERVWLPFELEFEEQPEFLWNPKLARYFQMHDQALKTQGYDPFLTITILNLQTPNLMRIYSNPMDPALFSVNIIGGLRETKYSGQNYIAISTHYTDSSLLTTRNVNISSLLETPTRHIIQNLPGISDLEKLKLLHDKKEEDFASLRPEYWRKGDEEKFVTQFRAYHLQFCRLNQESGLLRFKPSTNRYWATYKTALRGILNFFNPLMDNFTWGRFGIASLIGFCLPLVGTLYFEPVALYLSKTLGIAFPIAAYGYLAILFGLAGSVVGFLFTTKSLIWGFLLGYIPCRIILGVVPGGFLADLWMGLVADWVCNLRKKKENLL